MELLEGTEAEYRREAAKMEKIRQTDEPRAYAGAYCLLVGSRALGYAGVEKQVLQMLLEIFEKRAGQDVFLSGEMVPHFTAHLGHAELSSEKEACAEVLSRRAAPRPETEREAPRREFRELEPKISASHVQTERRSREKPHRRQIRREREAARAMGQAQAQRKRREDREYSSYIRAAEKKMQRQH